MRYFKNVYLWESIQKYLKAVLNCEIENLEFDVQNTNDKKRQRAIQKELKIVKKTLSKVESGFIKKLTLNEAEILIFSAVLLENTRDAEREEKERDFNQDFFRKCPPEDYLFFK